MDLPSEIISSSDIIAPGSPMLSKLSLNTKEILSLSGAQFMVPKNTEISVGINCANRVDQSSLALLNPLFSIKILFSPQMWGAGLPLKQ
jgi:hypothetical protein